MPIKYWIEKDHHRVRAVVSGDITIDDVYRAIQGSTEDADFEPGFDVLSDHTDVGQPLTIQQAKQMSSYLESLSGVMAHSRWAVITNQPASFGMMRMLSVFLEQVPMVLKVFGTLEEAERWLSQPKGRKEQNTQN
jgi:hypothetical protein